MKRLLFAALFATVAIGGAYAQATGYDASGVHYSCTLTNPALPSCSSLVLFDAPEGGDPIEPSTYNSFRYVIIP